MSGWNGPGAGPPLVELLDQRRGIGAYRLGDGADMPARVEVTPARRVVVVLDALDDVLPDPGTQADLGHAQAGMAACRGQCRADAHTRLPGSPRPYRRVRIAQSGSPSLDRREHARIGRILSRFSLRVGDHAE